MCRLASLGPAAVALVALVACTAPAPDAGSTSNDLSTVATSGSAFADVRAKVYATPLAEDALPTHAGLNLWAIAGNLFDDSNRPSQGLSIHSRRIFVDAKDERAPEPKWLHPRGACAEGRWTITEDSSATGLFAKGTRVRAIVRVSSGDKTSEGGELAGGRILGMAVKLFPTANDGKRVLTRNMVMLDQYGFERSKRLRAFHEDDGGSVHFTNVAPAKSAVGQFLSTYFDRFDKPNFARPVYAAARARVDAPDLAPAAATVPYEIRLAARASAEPLIDGDGQRTVGEDMTMDFRPELVRFGAPTLDIVIQSFDGTNVVAKRIGTLEFGAFVVSDYCDLSLHFHHDPIEDQLSKYTSYEVVKDLVTR
jgi:hypothetical protein